MWFFSQSATPARTALIYITVGVLTTIWTGVWYVYLYRNPPLSQGPFYWSTGFLVTGLSLIGIGLGLGWIGGQPTARADLPLVAVDPHTDTAAVVNPVAAAPAVANVMSPVATVPAAPVQVVPLLR